MLEHSAGGSRLHLDNFKLLPQVAGQFLGLLGDRVDEDLSGDSRGAGHVLEPLEQWAAGVATLREEIVIQGQGGSAPPGLEESQSVADAGAADPLHSQGRQWVLWKRQGCVEGALAVHDEPHHRRGLAVGI